MKISGHGLECELELSKPDIEGWMRTAVSVKVSGFEGSFSCTIEINEWKSLVELLRDIQASIGKEAKASWSNTEENIELQFTLHVRGALEGSYRFSPDNFSLGPMLSGTFEADQTFLQSWVWSAQQVLENAR
jgi:hypothetical protein